MEKKPALLFTSEETGEQWALPKEVVAGDRAKYYANQDVDTTYKEEFDFVMEDDYEAIDWFRNNMNPEDVIDHFVLIKKPREESISRKAKNFPCTAGEAVFPPETSDKP
jgi:hypothetical protein